MESEPVEIKVGRADPFVPIVVERDSATRTIDEINRVKPLLVHQDKSQGMPLLRDRGSKDIDWNGYRDTGEGEMWVQLLIAYDAEAMGQFSTTRFGFFILPNHDTYAGCDRVDMDVLFPENESIPLVAAVEMATTDWCGHNGDQYYVFDRNDLPPHAKAYYDDCSSIYGRNNLYLVTWIDT